MIKLAIVGCTGELGSAIINNVYKSKDEVVTFRHQVSSGDPFADGAIEVAKRMMKQGKGMYGMDEFCVE